MITCLSPNGGQVTEGDQPISLIKAATVRGIVTLARDGSGYGWTQTGRALEQSHIGSLTFEPRSGRLFAGLHGNGGLFVSDDGGNSWSERSNGLTSKHIYTIEVQYRGDQTVIWVGTEPAMLFRSDDLGESFYELPALKDVPDTERWTFPPPPHVAHVKQIAFHPGDHRTLYVCIEQGGLLKSEDDGQSWVELHGYEQPDMDIKFRHDAHRVVIRPANREQVYFAAGEGLYVSWTGGEDWQQLQSRFDRIGYPDALFVDPRDDRVVYLGGAGNAPEDWRESRNSNAGIIRSRDNGRNWEELKHGLPENVRGNIEAMGMHHAGPYLAILAGTATGEIYLSEDGGDHWQLIAEGLPPISKAGHYRWFLSEEARNQVVEEMWKWKAPYEAAAQS